MDALDRFVGKVEFAGDGCWLWTGYVKKDSGYPIYTIGRTSHRAHRWLYERIVEPIPAGMECDHLCRIRWCVNPDHIEIVTHAENNRRADARRIYTRKTHCLRGHEMTPENRRSGGYGCKACLRLGPRG